MRKIIAMIIILLFLTGSIPPKNQAGDIHEIQKIHENFAQNEQYMEWQVTMKEHINPSSIKGIVNHVENRHLVASTSDENRVQYIMEIIELRDMNAQIRIDHYKNENQAEIIVEIKGNKWNDFIAKDYDNLVTHIKHLYISQKAHVFACLSATYNATISRSQFEKKMIEVLDLKHVSKLEDPLTDPKKQVVLSGYSPHIKEKITIADEEYNIQIVMNIKDTEQYSVMIGTPIITNEY